MIRHILILSFIFIFSVSSELIISQASRQIYLSSPVEESLVQLSVENSGKANVNEVFVAVPPSKASHLAHVAAYLIEGKKDVKPLVVEQAQHNDKAPAGTKIFKVKTNIAPGATATIQYVSTFTHVLTPYPAEIAQGERQLVKFKDSVYVFSPYTIKSQATKVKLASTRVESYTKKDASLQGDEIEYGPYSDVAPFSVSELDIHSENNNPFATFRTLVREVEISHWGNIAVEENYLLVHDGAKLKGHFSRYDYQRAGKNSAPAAFRQIIAILPSSASDIYYRDQIGNISTSHVRESEEGIVVEVEPRFPMFGGWQIDFTFGYNLPASDFLFVDQNTGKYVLNVSYGHPFPAGTVDQYELRVIFPEGANGIEWATQFEVDSETYSQRLTYLDVTGRPVLILKKNNIVRVHSASPLLVAYNFSNVSLLREPFMIFVAFVAFFAFAILLNKFELSISSKVN